MADLDSMLQDQLSLLQKSLSLNLALARRVDGMGVPSTRSATGLKMANSTAALRPYSMQEPLLGNFTTSTGGDMRRRSAARAELASASHIDWDSLAAEPTPRLHARLHRLDSIDVPKSPSSQALQDKMSEGQGLQPSCRGFPDAESIKKTISKAAKTEYTVENLYKTEGCWQAVARSPCFEKMTLSMILFSTIWVAVDTDLNHATSIVDAALVFKIVDNIICIFFVSEFIVRFAAFAVKRDAFRDSWVAFDFCLVVLMIWDTWILYLWGVLQIMEHDTGNSAGMAATLRVFRLLRLVRVLRGARVFRAIPELMILVKGIAIAIRSVLATLIVLILVTYMFAIVFVQFLGGTELGADKFDNVLMAINFLFLQVVTGSFDAAFITDLASVHIVYYFIMLIFMLVSSLTIMNMLIGVLCEVVSAASEAEHELQNLKRLKNQIYDIVMSTDEDSDGTVTEDEFKQMLNSSDGMQKLYEAGVNVIALVDFADFIFRDCEEMTLDNFVDTVTAFRGSRDATVHDVVDLRVFLSRELQRLQLNLKDDIEALKDREKPAPGPPGLRSGKSVKFETN